jgi:hypothetical protein
LQVFAQDESTDAPQRQLGAGHPVYDFTGDGKLTFAPFQTPLVGRRSGR